VPDVLQFALTVAIGVVSGILSGMFGLGGAVVTTPAIRALGATTFEAIGSTLPSILPSSISGSLRYNREHLIRGRVVILASVVGVPAAVVGSRLSRAVPGDGHWLMIATALLIGFTAYRTAFPVERTDGMLGTAGNLRDQWWTLGVIGAAAGALSGLLGIGGGILMVPAFSAWVGLPLKETIATSLACVGIFAIPGTITHAVQGNVNWSYAIALAIGVIPGAQIGARITIASDDRTLRYTVGTALGIIAIVYGVGEINALI
jgi:uncharacterized membrane protein YfcA